jgi:hypothetical protein
MKCMYHISVFSSIHAYTQADVHRHQHTSTHILLHTLFFNWGAVDTWHEPQINNPRYRLIIAMQMSIRNKNFD